MKVLHAPSEIAGQASILARALRDLGVEAWSLATNPDFRAVRRDEMRRYDALPPLPRYLGYAGLAAKHLFKWDVFHFHFGRTLIPPHNLDLPLYRAARQEAGVPLPRLRRAQPGAHARDARALDLHRVRPPFCIPARQKRILREAEHHAHAELVSTPDLLESAPHAQQLHVAAWLADYPSAPFRETPRRVLHAPTNRLIKGTPYVERAFETLRPRFPGVEFQVLEQLPWPDLKAAMADCDVFVDQVFMGWYGMVTVEAMAMARPALCYIRPDFEPRMKDCPVVRTSVETLDGGPRRAAFGRPAPAGTGRAGPRVRRARARGARHRRAPGGPLPEPGGLVSIRDSLRRLSGDSLVYGLGQVGGKAVNLLLVPVLTRVLVPQQYGVSDLVTAYSASVLLVLVFGMDGALARFFYEQPDRDARIRMTSSSFVWRLVTGGTLALLAGGLFAEPHRGAAAGRRGLRQVPAHRRVHAAVHAARAVRQRRAARDVPAVEVHRAQRDADAARRRADALLRARPAPRRRRRALRQAHRRCARRRARHRALPAQPQAAFQPHHAAAHARASACRSCRCRSPTASSASWTARRCSAPRRWTRSASTRVAMKFFAVITMGVQAFNLAFGPFAYARAQDPDAPRLYARVFALYLALASLGALAVGVFAPGIVVVLATPRYARRRGARAVAGIRRRRAGRVLGRRARHHAFAAHLAAGRHRGGGGARRGGREPGADAATRAPKAPRCPRSSRTRPSSVLTYVVAQRVQPFPLPRARAWRCCSRGALALGWRAVRFSPPGDGRGWRVKLGAVLAFVGAGAPRSRCGRTAARSATAGRVSGGRTARGRSG